MNRFEHAYSLKGLMEADLPEPQWIIPDWLINEPTIIAGRPKTFKSTFAMEMAVAVASGTPMLDQSELPQQAPVVYIMEENSAGSTRALIEDIMMRKGLGRLALTGEGVRVWQGEDIPLYVLAREGFKLMDEWVDEAIEFCLEVGAKVVFIDAWYRVLPSGTDEKYGTDLADVFDRIQRFAKLEDPITPVLVAHMNKGGTTIDDDKGGVSIMGSTYVEGFFEGFMMTYHAKSGRNATVDIKRMYRNKAWPENVTVGLMDPHDRAGGWEIQNYSGKGKVEVKSQDKYHAFLMLIRQYEKLGRAPKYTEINKFIKSKVDEGASNTTIQGFIEQATEEGIWPWAEENDNGVSK